MALDNLEGIREYKDRLEVLGDGRVIVGLQAETQHRMLTVLFEEIDRLQRIVDTGKENRMESVTVEALHQRRRVRTYHVGDGPDLVPLD